MCHGAAAERRAAEARLHRVAIGDAEHPDYDAAGTLFAALHFELTTFERELYIRAAGKVGKTIPSAVNFRAKKLRRLVYMAGS